MRFWYLPAVVRSPDTNERRFALRPVVPVFLFGVDDVACCYGLVDTGSDSTIVPKSIADELQISFQPCEGPSPVAVGGGRLESFFADVELAIGDESQLHQWTCRVLIHEFESSDEETLILGRDGFLDQFTAVFDGALGILEVTPHFPAKKRE